MKKHSNKTQILYILLAVGVSFFLWFYVMGMQNSEVEVQITDIPVDFRGQSDLLKTKNLAIIEGMEQTVSIRLRGNRNTLVRVDKKAIKVEADLSSISDAGTFSVRYEVFLPVDDVRIVDRYPSLLTVKTDMLIMKAIPINVEITGTLPKGYVLDSTELEFDKVAVQVPSTLAESVSYAVAAIDLTDVTETLSTDIPLIPYTTDKKPLKQPFLQEHNTVKITRNILLEKFVPYSVNLTKAPGITAENVSVEFSPKGANIVGTKEQLAEISKINLGNIDLAATNTLREFNFLVTLPEGIRGGTDFVNSVTATVDLNGVTTKSIEIDTVTFENTPEGYESITLEAPFTVEVRGKTKSVEKLTAADFVATLDLRDRIKATGRVVLTPDVAFADAKSEFEILTVNNVILIVV